MARHWPPDGPSLPAYLDHLTTDLEEARTAMARDDRRSAKRWVQAALARPHPEAVDPAETVALVALGLGVVPGAPVTRIPRGAER